MAPSKSPSKKTPATETACGSRQGPRGVSKTQPAQKRRLQFDKPEAAAASSNTVEVRSAPSAAAAKAAVAAAKAAAAAAALLPLSRSEETELRRFDLSQKFGPCNGLSRADRWNRASMLGLKPPSHIFDLLQRVPLSSPAAQSMLSGYHL